MEWYAIHKTFKNVVGYGYGSSGCGAGGGAGGAPSLLNAYSSAQLSAYRWPERAQSVPRGRSRQKAFMRRQDFKQPNVILLRVRFNNNNNNRRLVTLAEHTSDHGRQTNSSTEEKGEQV